MSLGCNNADQSGSWFEPNLGIQDKQGKVAEWSKAAVLNLIDTYINVQMQIL